MSQGRFHWAVIYKPELTSENDFVDKWDKVHKEHLEKNSDILLWYTSPRVNPGRSNIEIHSEKASILHEIIYRLNSELGIDCNCERGVIIK